MQSKDFSSFRNALPFWMSLALLPLVWAASLWGGWSFLIIVVLTWNFLIVWDLYQGTDTTNLDTDAQEKDLYWYRLVTIIWAPLQFVTIFGVLFLVTRGDFAVWEQIATFAAVGFVSGTVGINYSHELMHQKNKLERSLADALLAMVLYSHFKSEHLLVHHTYVGTPRDPVTARYNESFYRYFPRVLWQCYRSAWHAEVQRLARKNKQWFDLKNPYYRYLGLQLSCIALAYAIAGIFGIFLFAIQALVAVFHLELVNYVEHYGLTRKHLGHGKYEHVKPHHSWNAGHKVSNWLLINLQRHSDHHYKPNRRFPLLQTYGTLDAPQLPYGYPVMTIMALFPRLWRSRMNRRVRTWRAMYYPEITDWTPYNQASTPMPR